MACHLLEFTLASETHACYIFKMEESLPYHDDGNYWYSRDTTTCFGPISGPSSGCDLTFQGPLYKMCEVFLVIGVVLAVFD